MAAAELSQLIQHPQFRQLVATHAQANLADDPVERVRSAVHHAVSKMFPGREKELADQAAGHAQKALQAGSQSRRSNSPAGNANRPLPPGARLARDGHHYVSDPNRPGKYLKVIHKNSQGRGASTSPAVAGGNIRDLLLVRHGETDMNGSSTSGNSVDRIRGHKDIPLNAAGEQQAHKTGQQLAASGFRPSAIVSSDLVRARRTAQIIGQHIGQPVNQVTPGFRPWDAGKLTGQNSKTAVPVMAQFAEKKPDAKLPGGESFHNFTGRFFIALATALQQHPDGVLLVVSHHRNERTLHAWKAAGYPQDGSIDLKTFNKKGEATGAAQQFQVPLDRLISAAQVARARGGPEPGNFTQAPQNERPGQE